MRKIIVAHLTDLHFSDKPYSLHFYDKRKYKHSEMLGKLIQNKKIKSKLMELTSHNQDAANMLADFINIYKDKLDHVIVTGDISTDGQKQSLLAGAHFLGCKELPSDNKHRGIRNSFNSDLSEIMLILPGNHDRYHRLAYLPGNKDFDSVFTTHWDKGKRIQLTKKQYGSEKILFVAVDFCLPANCKNPSKYMGQGYVDAPTCKELQDISKKYIQDGYAVVWLTHFPPLPLGNIDKSLYLDKHQDLMRAATDCGIALILSGHTHKTCCYEFSNTRVLTLGSSTCICTEEDNTFSIYSIAVDRGVIQSIDIDAFIFTFENDDDPGWEPVQDKSLSYKWPIVN